MKNHFSPIFTTILFLFLLFSMILLPGSCDLFNPSALNELMDNFERDNPADYGFWRLETVNENPPAGFYPGFNYSTSITPPFLRAGSRVFGISGIITTGYPSYSSWEYYSNVFFNPSDNWSWEIVEGPALTRDGVEDTDYYRSELDAYFVIGDTLYWLGNGPAPAYNNRFQAYDPQTGWVDRAPYPNNYKKLSRTEAGGKGYVSDENAFYQYDPDGDTWTNLNIVDLGYSTGIEQAMASGDTLWVIENHSSKLTVHSVDISSSYAGRTATYSNDLSLDNPAFFTSGSRFYILGLANNRPVRYFDCSNPGAGFQREEGGFPGTPYAPVKSWVGPSSFILGMGPGVDNYYYGLWEYVTGTDSWIELPESTDEPSSDPFSGRTDATVVIDGYLYWLDLGHDGDSIDRYEVWSYKLRS